MKICHARKFWGIGIFSIMFICIAILLASLGMYKMFKPEEADNITNEPD